MERTDRCQGMQINGTVRNVPFSVPFTIFVKQNFFASKHHRPEVVKVLTLLVSLHISSYYLEYVILMIPIQCIVHPRLLIMRNIISLLSEFDTCFMAFFFAGRS